MKNETKVPPPQVQKKRAWVRPELRSAGNVGDVLQGGGGKLSAVSQDPGDIRKPAGQG